MKSSDEHAEDLIAIRRRWQKYGTSLGHMYAQMKMAGMPDDEARFFVGLAFDRVLDKEFPYVAEKKE